MMLRSKLEAKDKPGLDYTAPTLPDVPNPQAMFMRLALGTIFVLGLCVVSLWGMRRWMLNPGIILAWQLPAALIWCAWLFAAERDRS